MENEPVHGPKSILKKPRRDTTPPSDKKHRDVAAHHATILQQRKELEATVLDSIVALSEFPLVRAPSHTARDPAPADVAQFKSHVRLFQPTDYDDLIIERNAGGLCGYPLCPRPNRKNASGAKWKLVNMGRQDFDIVSTEELEKWCCQDCKKRALWIRIQLAETAAWEREGMPDLQIYLYGEDETTTSSIHGTAQDLAKLQLDEKRRAESAGGALALERGDHPDSARVGVGLVDVVIREKSTSDRGNPNTFDDDAGEGTDDEDADHLLTEGYRVKFGAWR